ncbi:cytochrome c3 family protein [Ferrimonas sp.]|uniref:cytochrome c3 family protein n=1 Tax=Ferrimonas sp. TaxID=2080861 RepID=UPI003A93E6AB
MKTQLQLAGLALLVAASGGASAQESCAGECHIIQPYVEAASDTRLLSSRHLAMGLECTDCHEQDAQTRAWEAEAYAKGEYDDPMYTREFDNEFCLRCHEGYEALAQQTHHLEEAWGINPHHSHVDPECYQCHKSHQPSTLLCGECHTAEWDKRLPQGWSVNN